MIRYDKSGVIFQFTRDERVSKANLDKFIMEAFRFLVEKDHFHLVMHLLEEHESILQKQWRACNEIIIQSFARSPCFYEIKIGVFMKFEDYFEYGNYDRILEAIEGHFSKESKYQVIANSINPLLTPLCLLDLLFKIREKHNVLEFRCKEVQDQITKQCRSVLINFTNPKEVRAMVNQRDIFGMSAMSYME